MSSGRRFKNNHTTLNTLLNWLNFDGWIRSSVGTNVQCSYPADPAGRWWCSEPSSRRSWPCGRCPLPPWRCPTPEGQETVLMQHTNWFHTLLWQLVSMNARTIPAIIMSWSASAFFRASSCSAVLSWSIMSLTSPSSLLVSWKAFSASSLVLAEPWEDRFG